MANKLGECVREWELWGRKNEKGRGWLGLIGSQATCESVELLSEGRLEASRVTVE